MPTPEEGMEEQGGVEEDLDLPRPQETPEEKVGVGITLSVNSGGSMCVHSVCQGGSAENSLQPGDVLLAIGGESVQGMPAQHLAGLLLGPPDSTVDIAVRREAAVPGFLTGEHITTQQHHRYTLTRKGTDPQLARTAIITRDAMASQESRLDSSPAALLTVPTVPSTANREPGQPQPTVERPPTLSEEECAKILERGDP